MKFTVEGLYLLKMTAKESAAGREIMLSAIITIPTAIGYFHR